LKKERDCRRGTETQRKKQQPKNEGLTGIFGLNVLVLTA
jgi:hypothetical protein